MLVQLYTGLVRIRCDNLSKYDLIGDIHGHANDLIELLEHLDYKKVDGCYRHPERQVIFLGDFVDRGSNQRKVLDIVMPMVNQKAALAVMGNHELNALAYHTNHPTDKEKWLRPRTNRNTGQHLAFLQDYLGDEKGLNEVLDWFMQLPLWLELPGLRAIHAYWHKPSMQALEKHLNANNTLTPELLFRATSKDDYCFDAVELLLKGLELKIPNDGYFYDKDGNKRVYMRTQWWVNDAKTFGDISIPFELLKGLEAEYAPIDSSNWSGYKASEPPLFMGHYWFKGTPKKLADNVACLDYSVARGGKLVAYRFDGEQVLDNNKFVFVE